MIADDDKGTQNDENDDDKETHNEDNDNNDSDKDEMEMMTNKSVPKMIIRTFRNQIQIFEFSFRFQISEI